MNDPEELAVGQGATLLLGLVSAFERWSHAIIQSAEHESGRPPGEFGDGVLLALGVIATHRAILGAVDELDPSSSGTARPADTREDDATPTPFRDLLR